MAGEHVGQRIQAENNQSEDAKRKEELERQIRKRVASEERAFRIVESLVDVTVSFERLKDMAHFILPAHYKDITEERAITKICGFPVCKAPLGKVTKQKYQISTKTNKVYDITEKKNFCSSKCFKQSKIFEKQILTSLLWTRELEQPAEFLLPDSETGWLGIEVISPETIFNSNNSNQAEVDEETPQNSSILDNRNWINELHESICAEKTLNLKESKNKNEKSESLLDDVAVDPSETAAADSLEVPIEDENQGFDLRDVSDFLKEQMSDGEDSERLSTEFDSDDDEPDSMVETTPPLRQKKKSSCSQIDNLNERILNINISKDEENTERWKNRSDNKVEYFKKLLNSQTKSLSSFIDAVPIDGCVQSPTLARDVTNKLDSPSDLVSAASLSKPKITESGNPAPNHHQIQNCLHSWITQESLRYLGLATNEECNTVEEFESATQNTDFAKLCDRLDMRGLEFDELLEERVAQTISGPKRRLPSYEKLQKETAKFGLKVKEYYKASPTKKEEKTSDSSEPFHQVPHVDSVSQLPIRRTIVLQQLGNRMNELLNPMDVMIGEISTEIKELVSTFNLQSNNITFKPAEWSVIGIFVIFMLSKKLKRLDVTLQKTKVEEKFTAILKRYNLNLQEVRHILDNEMLHQ